MPQISDRAVKMPASPIRRLAPFAERAAADGVHIYHLNIGQPDIESPAEFWSAVRAEGLKILEYSHSAGRLSLRKRAAEAYRRAGIEVDDSQIVVTTAGSEALRFAMMACLNPGDEVIVPEPLYANYLGFAVESGVSIKPLSTSLESDFALPPIDQFERQITPRTKAILICNPSNPTGSVYSMEQLFHLRDLVLRHDLYLIADEVYREFNYTGAPIASVLQLEGLDEHAVMVDSVSKRFSLCGARIGFMVSRSKRLMGAALKFAQARLSPPTLEQIGVEAALEAPASFFEAVRKEYRARRDLLVERLSRMPGVVCPRIDGAFYAMVRLPIDDGDRFCQWLLETYRRDGATVMLAPGSGFYASEGKGANEVRIAYVLGEKPLGAAMDCLGEALLQYPGRVDGTRAAAAAS